MAAEVTATMIQQVEALIRAAAAEAILPRYQQLAAADITEKSPGELVTAADHASEQIITAGLLALLPGSLVVGEEATEADSSLLSRLSAGGYVWLVDPLDGTRNFAEGHGPFAVMVALLRDGVTLACWMLDPLSGTCAIAEAGAGATVGGVRAHAPTACPPLSALRGAVLTRYLPPDVRARVEVRLPAFGEILPGFGCAGREYPAIVLGEQDFALFRRTLPWDHAPGVLFAREAGATASRLDGSPYQPADSRTGLLIAGNIAIWEQARAALFGDSITDP